MNMQTLTTGMLETNCYLVFDDASKTLYIIDPGADAPDIAEAAGSFAFEHCQVLLTHAHVDHIAALPELARVMTIDKVCLHPADLPLYHSVANAILPYIPHPENLPETQAPCTNELFKVLALPGHTQGGVGYYFAALNAVFAGDTIFRASVGRTDLPGGDFEQLSRSIRNELYTLDDKTRLYCGHGPWTTVEFEKKNNPYVSE